MCRVRRRWRLRWRRGRWRWRRRRGLYDDDDDDYAATTSACAHGNGGARTLCTRALRRPTDRLGAANASSAVAVATTTTVINNPNNRLESFFSSFLATKPSLPPPRDFQLITLGTTHFLMNRLGQKKNLSSKKKKYVRNNWIISF